MSHRYRESIVATISGGTSQIQRNAISGPRLGQVVLSVELDAYAASLRLEDTAPVARRVEELGFSGSWFTESQRPPYLACAVVTTVTSSIDIGTAIVVAFSPQPDGHGAERVGARPGERRPVRARPRHPGEGAHRTPVLDAFEHPGPRYASTCSR